MPAALLRCATCTHTFTVNGDALAAVDAFNTHPCNTTGANDMPQAVDRGQLTNQQRAEVEQNLGLVHAHLRKLRVSTHDYDDRFQDGVIGLMRAVQMFDPARGYALSTYAMHWIRVAVDRGEGFERGVDYRRAAEGRGEFPDGTLSLDAPYYSEAFRDNGAIATLGDTIADPDSDAAFDAVIADVDAGLLVERLKLTEDEVAVLVWPTAETARWLGLTTAGVNKRRRVLRRRLAAQLAA